MSHIIEGYPYETCGVLIGQESPTTVVVMATLANNLNRDKPQTRYLLDPLDQKKADDQARARGLDIIGIWHSHPDHPAKPSLTDLEGAWLGWHYVIASVTKEGVQDMRSWVLRNNVFIEEEIRDESR